MRTALHFPGGDTARRRQAGGDSTATTLPWLVISKVSPLLTSSRIFDELFRSSRCRIVRIVAPEGDAARVAIVAVGERLFGDTRLCGMVALLRLVVLFGGVSAEHDVSRVTAAHVLAAADRASTSWCRGHQQDGSWVRNDDAMARLPMARRCRTHLMSSDGRRPADRAAG